MTPIATAQTSAKPFQLHGSCVVTLLTSALLAGANFAQAPAPGCLLKPDDLSKVFAVKFAPGVAEPPMAGTSCRYATQGGLLANGTDFSVWIIDIPAGPNQDMMRTMTLGPRSKLVPIAGDPDKAERVVRSGDNENLIDVVYKRAGSVVILRSQLSHEADAAKREKRNADHANKLLQLPRQH